MVGTSVHVYFTRFSAVEAVTVHIAHAKKMLSYSRSKRLLARLPDIRDFKDDDQVSLEKQPDEAMGY